METKDLFTTLKRFDAYPKTLEDFRIKTFGGAAGKNFIPLFNFPPKKLQVYSTFNLILNP